MKKQVLYPGNLVEVLFGHPLYEIKDGKSKTIDMSPELVNQKAIIKEKSGSGSYSLIFLKDGHEEAWFDYTQLKFINEGGPHLFRKAEKVKEKIKKRDIDIQFIKKNLNSSLSSTSILKLFSLLGHTSSFLKNGEYFALLSDWYELQPCFVIIRDAKTLDEAKGAFTLEGNSIYNVEAVYNAFNKV